VNYVSEDLRHRQGEGVAGPSEIWVQPPGTPTVGLAFLAAYEAIPAALDWLQRWALPDGRLARYYELRTNRPLYMKRLGGKR
jgi:hypothetical protein